MKEAWLLRKKIWFGSFNFFIKKNFNILLLGFLLTSIVGIAFNTFFAETQKVFVDKILINKDLFLLIKMSMILILIFCLNSIFSYVYSKVKIKYMNLYSIKLRETIINKYLLESISKLNHISMSEIKTIIEDDANKIVDFYQNHCLQLLFNLLNIIWFSTMILRLNIILATILMVLSPLVIKIGHSISKRLNYYNQLIREKNNEYNDWLNKTLVNWRQVKIHSLEEKKKIEFRKYQGDIVELNRIWQYYFMLIIFFQTFKNEIFSKILIYALVGLFLINGNMSIGNILLFISFYNQLYNSIEGIFQLDLNIKSDRFSFERIMSHIGFSQIGNKQEICDINSIETNNLAFSYVDSVLVLNKMTLRLESNKIIGIIGRSGSGKSTLFNCLLGILEPQNGRILINDNYDLENIKNYYNYISVANAESNLFNDTVYNNISLDSMMDKQKVETLMKELGIGDISLNDQVNENGNNFSGGQKQLLILARTLAKKANYYFFDDATTSISLENENRFNDIIKKISDHSTIVIATHRISTIQNCDLIYFIENGEIVARGKFNDLINSNHSFRSIFYSK